MIRKYLALAVISVLAFAFLNGTVLNAQSVLEGKIVGTVSDEKGELLPGVNVELSGPSIMGRRATVTSARGGYVFLNVPPGKFKVTVTLPGFKTYVQEDLILGAGSSLEINPVLQVGPIEEQITVLAASPIVDVKTSTVDSRLESTMLAKLPSTRDAFYDMAVMTPGMFEVGTTSSWQPSPTAYGGSSMENVFLINGVNTTDPRGASFGTLVSVNYNAVEEVRVLALGAKAEYGSYSGAAIDVLTKSGSNRFHGNAAYYTELRGDTFFKTNQPPDGSLSGHDWLYVQSGDVLAGVTKKNWEGNFTLGGPIVKDKVWFYGAFDYIRSASLPVNWSLLNNWWGRYADLKISAEPFAKSRAWVSYHREWNKGDGWSWGNAASGWDTSMTYGVKTVNDTISAQLQWLPTGNAIFTAKYLGFWTNDTPFIPADHPDHPGYINWYKWAEYGIEGAFPYIEGFESNRHTIQADMSYYAEDFLGEHDIKFGAQYTKGRGNSLGGFFQNYVNYTYPLGYPSYVYDGGRWVGLDIASWKDMWYFYPGWYDFGSYDYVDPENGLVFTNDRQEINPYLTVRTADSLGFFFDDQWSPVKRLTFNIGLRYDRMTTKYGVGKIYEKLTSPTDIANPVVIGDRAATGNIFDFRTLSPRLGITYQLTKDAKTVLRANYGRYYMPLAVEFLRRFGPDMPLTDLTRQWWQIPWDLVDLNGNGVIDIIPYEYEGASINEVINAVREIPNLAGPVFQRPVEQIDGSWSLDVADDVKDMHTDQFMLNLERELVKDLSLSATYIYKHSTSMFVNVPIDRTTGEEWAYVRVPFTLANGKTVDLWSIDLSQYPGGLPYIRANSTQRVENMGTYEDVKPHRTYQAVQFVLNKRFSDRWQGLASLIYSWSDGTAQRTQRQNDNMMGPMLTDDTWMASLNYTINNMDGPLPFVPKWEFKVSGSYSIPVVEVDLGARFRFSTGRPLWQLFPIPASLWGSQINAAGLGRVVGDTTPTHLPSLNLLDLRAEKAIKLKNYGSLHIVLDVFNIFNTANITNADFYENWGRITGVSDPRRFRLSFMYQF